MTGILSITQLVGQLIITNNTVSAQQVCSFTRKVFRKFYCTSCETSRQALVEDTKITKQMPEFQDSTPWFKLIVKTEMDKSS